MEVCVYQTRVQKHDIRVEESMVDTRYTHCVEYQIRLVHLKGKLNGVYVYRWTKYIVLVYSQQILFM